MLRAASRSRSERFLTYAKALSVITRVAMMPWAAKNARALEEAGDGGGAFVVMQFDVGQPRAVVDDRVGVIVADAGVGMHPVAVALRAIAGGAMSGPTEARVAADVHVQQIARTRQLVAVRCPTFAGRAS
jgi:hypothetical protein